MSNDDKYAAVDDKYAGQRFQKDAPHDAPAHRITDNHPARAGDTITRKTDGQRYRVACDEEGGRVYTAGWPEASEEMEGFDVTNRASAAERITALESLAAGRNSGGMRKACARRQLHAIEVTKTLEEIRAAAAGSGDITRDIAHVTEWAERKGWHVPAMCAIPGDPEKNTSPDDVNVDAVASKLMLIVTEISEAMEELRIGPENLPMRIPQETGKPEGFVTELADAYIRMVHLCGMLGLDLETAVALKMRYNETRSFRHGGKQA